MIGAVTVSALLAPEWMGWVGMRFPVGKLPSDLLSRLLDRYRLEDERVVLGARIGEDAAVLDMGDRYLVAKTDPITFATDEIGWYAVQVNANDLVTTGATPLWFLATVLLPEGKSDEALAEEILHQMHGACQQMGISLVGGHTEISYGLDRPIVVGHMLGEVDKGRLVTTGGAEIGDAIVLTKGIAIEGTALVSREKEAYLRDRGYSEAFLRRAQAYLHDPGISVYREARLARDRFGVHAMHDPTEGGLATGLQELAEAAQVGLLVHLDSIDILPECRVLCQEFGLDPMGTIASGALLIVLPLEQADALVDALAADEIEASIIGWVEPPNAGTMLEKHGELSALPTFPRDEVARLFAQ
jgi:hydrogenase expression/formation protein HypE